MDAIRNPRILHYSHDTVGLGHLRRTLSIAEHIADNFPGVRQLLITGSMQFGSFRLPRGLDVIKLPALAKHANGRYRVRELPLRLQEVLAWRREMILQTATHFAPDIMLVDKAAAGVHGELLPTLHYLKTRLPRTRIVLGMRDIEDAPKATMDEWDRNGIRPLLDDVYDRILLYGQRSVFDPIEQYEMSAAAAAKLIECGYLRRARLGPHSLDVRSELGIGTRPLVVATVGGGSDGNTLLKSYVDMLALGRTPAFHSVVVTGPLMESRHRRALALARRRSDVTFLEFTPNLERFLVAADVVVSMAGYNTVCEILSLGKRAILIPRNKIREEQRLRAERLVQLGLVEHIAPHELSAQRLLTKLEARLRAPAPIVDLNLDGLDVIVHTLRDLLRTGDVVPLPLPQHSPVSIQAGQ